MPPLGKCLCGIARAVTMVEEFAETTQNTYKTQFLASSNGTYQSLVVMINLGPKRNLYSAH